ncbi:MAG: hypothetical protein LBQ94_04205 [Treponema sp.]|jgi:hypothetical protein|nr:hypothetical protein [Treponema sp.]
MLNPGRSIKILVLFVILALLLSSGIALRVFFTRPPVLIVIDVSFSQLYGPDRLERQIRSVSLSLFRQVIPVPVDESAGPELVAIAVEETFDEPWAVIFPYRYIAGARRYREAMPETPVFVIGNPLRLEGEAFTFVNTDTDTDLYRAGMAAALFTGEKRPLFFSDGALSEELREVFRQGLTDNGCLQEPVFLNAITNYLSWENIGCVVVAGPAARFAEQNLDIPVILFSWIDPSLTPGTVKLLFDDSHLTLAVEALKALPAAEILLPSSPTIFRDRIGEKGIYSKLKDIIRKK